MFEDFYDEFYDENDDDDNEKSKKQRRKMKQQQTFKKFSASDLYNKSMAYRRLVVVALILIVIIFFVHNTPSSSDVEIILDVNKMRLEKVDRSSMILDALRKKKQQQPGGSIDGVDHVKSGDLPADTLAEEPVIPAFRLITEFKNGIYFYNIHEPIESWVVKQI